MPEKSYFRASLGLKSEVAETLAEDYHSSLVNGMRANGGLLELEQARLTFHLAKEFGFCYGVDKAIDLAYEARRKFPDKRIFLLTEIIHNPRVNRRMLDMGIIFLSGQYRSHEHTIDDITKDDVVLIPAFGASVNEFAYFYKLGAIVVDTTCGSVVHVWKRVERYGRDGFTSIVHGKFYHEETIATVSQALGQGGHFLVVRDKTQTQAVCDFIVGKIDEDTLLTGFNPNAYSPGFDPKRHLQRVGVANQTTMLASESLEIAAMIGDAVAQRDGVVSRADTENFRSFDTICSATQDRQDAIQSMVAESPVDLILVIGGYNSSNTGHLLEVARRKCPAFHIEDSSEMVSAEIIRHLPFGAKSPVETHGWLPEKPLHIGLTAGASTPNRAIADTIARLLVLRGCSVHDAMAALDKLEEG